MRLIHRPIRFASDRDYVLECHCRINYECDCPWARKVPYETYRAEWFAMSSQISSFYEYLEVTAKDPRCIAEIIENDVGDTVGYLWVPFNEDVESGFRFADIQDVYVEPPFRRMGVAVELLLYAERRAKESGAKVIRSGTGCENLSSIRLHEKRGFYQYRLEFEKLL